MKHARESDQENERGSTRQRGKKRGSTRPTGRSNPVRALHRSIGNQAVQALHDHDGLQASLELSRPRDPDEREAERVAETIMRKPDPGAVGDTTSSGPSNRVRRLCSRCRGRLREGNPLNCPSCETELHRKEDSGASPPVSTRIQQGIRSLRGDGRPLPATARSFFEPRFGRDFSDVRIHTGPAADAAGRSLDATAFTLGRDIVFRSGEYRPETDVGKRLLAHELTHVLQQRNIPGSHAGTTGPRIDRQTDAQGETETGTNRARELVDKHTNWWGMNLDEEALARDLLHNHLLADDARIVNGVFDEVDARNVDDVSRQLADQMSDEQLRTVAGNKPGRDVLRRMVRALITGPSMTESNERIVRIMDAITTARPAAEREERDEPAAGGQERVDVKVITFGTGAVDIPFPEYHERIPGVEGELRGHTAMIVGGYVYSYSGEGWECGITEAEYKRANEHRAATVQVLDIPEADAKQLQRDLNGACNTGVYGIQGDCTSNSARFLQEYLDVQSSWSPIRFRNHLGNSGHVTSSYRWNVGGEITGKDTDGEQDSETVTIELEETTITGNVYTVRPGDTLWDVAEREYGDGRKWPVIFKANEKSEENPGGIEDPDLIHPGQRLIIPDRSEAEAFDASEYELPASYGRGRGTF